MFIRNKFSKVMISKSEALKLAVEIAKESGRGGHGQPQYVLEEAFKVLIKLLPQANAPITD